MSSADIPYPAPGPEQSTVLGMVQAGGAALGAMLGLRVLASSAGTALRALPGRRVVPGAGQRAQHGALVHVLPSPVLPAFSGRTPYNAVVVALDEGPLLVSSLVDCPDADVAVGLRVETVMMTVDDDLTLPLFRPLADATRGERAG